MKLTSRYCLAGALAAALFTFASRTAAAEDTTPPPPPPNADGPGHPGGHGPRRMDPEKQLQRMTERLGLTAEQQAQIRPILQSFAEKRHALWQQQKEARGELRASIQKINTEERTQVAGLLSADQKAKWAQRGHKGDHHNGDDHHEGDAGGPPPPPPPPQS